MTPMVKRLEEENRVSRRTVADVLDVIFSHHGSISDPLGQFAIGPVRHARKPTYIIDVYFFGQWSVVSLPTSATFVARNSQNQIEESDVGRLLNAVVHPDGTVILADGTSLRAVEVLPTQLYHEPTMLDRRILAHVIAYAELKPSRIEQPAAPCFRRLAEDLPEHLRDSVGDLGALDYSRIRQLRVPYLKQVKAYIEKTDPKLKVSIQTIANVLARFDIEPGPFQPWRTGAPATI
jgi:hypothetical protein